MRTSSLTRQLLIFSRGEHNDPQTFDVVDTLVDFVPMLVSLLPDVIELELDIRVENAWINADRSEIDQLLMNLVLNARDAIADAGRIGLEIDSDKEYVTVSVSDSGGGIPDDVREHIFEPFFSTKSEKGLGLGLANAKSIVEKAGGELSLATSPAGTVFTIRIPVADQVPATQAESKQEVADLGGLRILLVDDQPALLKVQEVLLQRSGMQVIAMSNSIAAAELLSNHPSMAIDVLVTDMLMPRVTGADLIEAAIGAGVRRAVLVSGFVGEASVDHLREQISLSFLSKPYTHDQLLREIRQLVASG